MLGFFINLKLQVVSIQLSKRNIRCNEPSKQNTPCIYYLRSLTVYRSTTPLLIRVALRALEPDRRLLKIPAIQLYGRDSKVAPAPLQNNHCFLFAFTERLGTPWRMDIV